MFKKQFLKIDTERERERTSKEWGAKLTNKNERQREGKKERQREAKKQKRKKEELKVSQAELGQIQDKEQEVGIPRQRCEMQHERNSLYPQRTRTAKSDHLRSPRPSSVADVKSKSG